MTLVKRLRRHDLSPVAPARNLEDYINRFFGDLGTDLGMVSRDWMPDMDVRETEGEYIVEADIPGMTREDIHLEVVDNTLTVRGERTQEEESKKGDFHRIERRYGSFLRTVEIPGGFDSEKVDAEFKNGVLKVKLPKLEETKAKRIEVKMK